MNTNKSKVIAALIASSMLLGLTSCNVAKDVYDEDEVTEVVTQYFKLIKKGKFDDAAELTTQNKDAFKYGKLDKDEAAILDALVATTDYDIHKVKESDVYEAEVKLEINLVSVSSAADYLGSSYSVDDLIDQFDDTDETFGSTITITVEYDEDREEWLVSSPGASDIAQIYNEDIDEADLSFSKSSGKDGKDGKDGEDDKDGKGDDKAEILPFSEENCNAAMDDRIAYTLGLTIEDMYNNELKTNPDITMEEFVGDNQAIYDFLLDSLHLTTIEYEVNEIGDNYIIYSYIAYVPDTQDLSDYFLQSDEMVALMGDMLITPVFDDEKAVDQIMATLLNYVHSEPEYRNYYGSATATYNPETGGYDISGIEEVTSQLVPNLDFSNTLMMDEAFLTRVADYLYDNGKIGEEQYQAYIEEAQRLGACIQVQPGSDYYDFTLYEDENFTYVTKIYKEGDPGIYMIFETQNNYNYDDTFTITVTYNDAVIVNNHLSYCGRNRCNEGKIKLSGPLKAGDYVITITGYNGEEFATISITVIE